MSRITSSKRRMAWSLWIFNGVMARRPFWLSIGSMRILGQGLQAGSFADKNGNGPLFGGFIDSALCARIEDMLGNS